MFPQIGSTVTYRKQNGEHVNGTVIEHRPEHSAIIVDVRGRQIAVHVTNIIHD